jgi:hypothetical protein
LDSEAFVAARAKYFQALEEFRESNVHLYYHDETWMNLREVKRSIWTLDGKGKIKQGEGRGKLRGHPKLVLSLASICLVTGSRLAVSALISVNGYHIPSVDIWACTKEHNMDSKHFLSWLDSTCATLRKDSGELTHFPLIMSDSFFAGDRERIAICLDNATWHNILTDESIIPKRASRKEEIQKWLKDRKIKFPEKLVKAQLLELVSANCPPKEYFGSQFFNSFF